MAIVVNVEDITRFYRGKTKRYIMDPKDLKTNNEKKPINHEVNRIRIDKEWVINGLNDNR